MRRVNHVLRCLTVVVAATAVTTCAPRAIGTRPDDMSAADHRRAAAEQERRADAQASPYERETSPAGVVSLGFPVVSNINADSSELADIAQHSEHTYDPTAEDFGSAAHHRAQAAQHRTAAQVLEHFTDNECAELPSQTRTVCPLPKAVSRVESYHVGVVLHLRSGASTDEVLARIGCYRAFARERHYRGASQCPLYVQDISVERGNDGDTIRIVGGSREAQAEVRNRAKHIRGAKRPAE